MLGYSSVLLSCFLDHVPHLHDPFLAHLLGQKRVLLVGEALFSFWEIASSAPIEARRTCPPPPPSLRKSRSSTPVIFTKSSSGVFPSNRYEPSGRDRVEGLFLVVLVADVAHDLLEDILHGDQPGGAPVLVHHDGHVVSCALYGTPPSRSSMRFVAGHEVGRPYQGLPVEARWFSPSEAAGPSRRGFPGCYRGFLRRWGYANSRASTIKSITTLKGVRASITTISLLDTRMSSTVLSLKRIIPSSISFSCSLVISLEVISSALERLSTDMSCLCWRVDRVMDAELRTRREERGLISLWMILINRECFVANR
jgi:hypothetical protein